MKFINIVFPFFLLLTNVTHSESGEKITRADEFDILVRRLAYNPDDLPTGDQLRDYCRENKIVDKCIDSLNSLTKKHPKNKFLRYQAALAYVDEVPGHSLFRQGWLSSRSMEHMTKVIESVPDDWAAYYIRGLNGLYWPKSFRKLPKAIQDLEHCVELSLQLPRGLVKPYHAFAYIALGDALVKYGDVTRAREIYALGQTHYNSPKLRRRMDMNDNELEKTIKKLRHTDQRVDTEISFLVNGGIDKL